MILEMTIDQAKQILQILQTQPLPLVQSLPLVQLIGQQVQAVEQATAPPTQAQVQAQLREVS